jgi:PhzF family phenazine biosynthesis protein
MKITELLCFGVQPGQGNPALVVQGDGWEPGQRQHFAYTQQRSACVFIDTAADGGVLLDYYYPHTRSPLCLHATLAAASVLLDQGENAARTAPAAGADASQAQEARTLTVRTALLGQQLRLSRSEAGLFVALQRQPAPAVALAPDLPSRLLAMPGVQLASAPVIVSAGSPKLLLELPDCATLQALRPDLALIAAWGKEHGVNGCYAWARRADGALEGRSFNHLDPALEDSATGVAAAALTLHLGHGVNLYQGANRGQPCLLRTALQGETVLAGGAAHAIPYHATAAPAL